MFRRVFTSALVLSFLSAAACGGGSDVTEGAPGAGAAAGVAGTSAGQGGKAGAGQGGAGHAGASGAGKAGASGGGAAGASGGGAAGASGGGAAGAAGASGGGAAGASGAGTGGVAGASGAGTGGSVAGTSGTSGAGAGGGGPTCEDTCKSGVCVGQVCCPDELACDTVCCPSSTVCSFGKCVTPGKPCTESADCGGDDYCDFGLGTGSAGAAGQGGAGGQGGGTCFSGGKTGKCLPKPPECPPGGGGAGGAGGAAGGAGSPTCIEKCEVKPATPAFDPEVKFAWGGQTTSPYATDVMMTPIVVQLDDDNCDGKINENDIPEIVFSTFRGGAYYKQGTLHAISVVEGKVVDKFAKADVVQPGAGLAAADLDGDGVPEIVGCMNPGPSGTSCCDAVAYNTGVIAFNADGSTKWTQPDTTQVHCGTEAPAIGDVDGDGKPEVLVGFALLDGATGAIKKNLDPLTGYGARLTGLADLDGDGLLDVTDGQRAYRADGTVLWDLRLGPDAIPAGYHAVGDLDRDGKPEVVIISSSGPHTMSVVQWDPGSPSGAKVLRKGIDINNGISTKTFCNAASEYGGGAPTIADFDGDGFPDVGAAGAVGYIVLSGQKLMDGSIANGATTLWFKTTHDCSSAVTGSSVFDFNGDGQAEVIYSDEYHLWMYDGKTGTNLIPSTCNTTGTLWEYPLIADVDNDGQADIIVASNAYSVTCPDDGSKQSGIRIFGSKTNSWVRTRRVWNQHTYHVTNIGEDGKVPAHEPKNWTAPGLNNYRQNKQPGLEFAAPDAAITKGKLVCAPVYSLSVVVTNLGQAVLPKGVSVAFYKGTPPGGALLGTAQTSMPLYPAQSEVILFPTSDADVKGGAQPWYAVVDDGGAPHPSWTECRTNNNTFGPTSGVCKN